MTELPIISIALAFVSVMIASYNLGWNLCKYRMEEQNRKRCENCRQATIKCVKEELKRQLGEQGYDID